MPKGKQLDELINVSFSNPLLWKDNQITKIPRIYV